MTKFTEFFASVWKVIIKGDMERVPGYIAVGGLSWVDGYCESQPVGAANQGNTQVLLFLLWIGIGVLWWCYYKRSNIFKFAKHVWTLFKSSLIANGRYIIRIYTLQICHGITT